LQCRKNLIPGVVRCDDEYDAHGVQDDKAGHDVVLEQWIMLLPKK
jgi:hypothetical protein